MRLIEIAYPYLPDESCAGRYTSPFHSNNAPAGREPLTSDFTGLRRCGVHGPSGDGAENRYSSSGMLCSARETNIHHVPLISASVASFARTSVMRTFSSCHTKGNDFARYNSSVLFAADSGNM